MEEQAVGAFREEKQILKPLKKRKSLADKTSLHSHSASNILLDSIVSDENPESDIQDYCNETEEQNIQRGFKYNFWVCTYPNFESALYINSEASISFTDNSSESGVQDKIQMESIELLFFDADGVLFNNCEIDFPSNEFLSLKISTFMASCKMQAGMKHARLEVKSKNKIQAKLRLYAKDSQQVLEPLRFISRTKPDFFALTFAADRMAYLVVTNPSGEIAELRIKVFCVVSGLDLKLKVPIAGAQVFEIASLFPQILALKEERSFPAYLRIYTKSDQALGIQFYEQRVV